MVADLSHITHTKWYLRNFVFVSRGESKSRQAATA